MRKLLLLGLVLTVGCAGGGHVITGTLELTADGSGINWDYDGGCYGDGGYSDIAPGAQVLVTDQEGRLIASGAVGLGQRMGSTRTCRFLLQVDDVPGADFYTIEISHRGGLTYSADEMKAMGWEVGFTLGS